MKLDSRQTIHIGINLVSAPAPVLDRPSARRFQEYLEDADIAFTNTEYKDRLLLVRDPIKPLQINVGVVGPQVGQLVIVAGMPDRSIADFCEEAEKVLVAYERAWPAQARQLVHVDATIRDLYETSTDHAFKELWETRLHQRPDSLQALGPGLAGGGLRFVIPPADADHLTPLMEVKIESFLQNSHKLFIETQFLYTQPAPLGAPTEITQRLNALNDYARQDVVSFIQEGQQ